MATGRQAFKDRMTEAAGTGISRGGRIKSYAGSEFDANNVFDSIKNVLSSTIPSSGSSPNRQSSSAVSPVGGVPTTDDTTDAPTNPGLFYGYGSLGGGNSGPSENQREAAKNLGAVVGYNADTIKDNYDDMMSIYDLADQQNQALRDNNLLIARQGAGSDWFRQHLKLQRTASALNDRSGNALRGSYLYDYRDLLRTADDNIDSETLDTQRENENSILQSYFESAAQNAVNRDEAAADVEKGLRELYADYVAQVNNIHPDLAEDMLDTEGHTLNGTDWLKTDFFDSHRAERVEPERRGLYRPDQATTTARRQGLTGGSYDTGSAVMRSYWDRMNRGYDQRTMQA